MTVKMKRSTPLPTPECGPLTADVHSDQVSEWLLSGWEIIEEKVDKKTKSKKQSADDLI